MFRGFVSSRGVSSGASSALASAAAAAAPTRHSSSFQNARAKRMTTLFSVPMPIAAIAACLRSLRGGSNRTALASALL